MHRLLRPLTIAFSGLLAASSGHTQETGPTSGSNWQPTSPIRYVVPAPAGGLIDTMARLVEQGIRSQFKQPIVIDNRPGAGTVLGAQEVARSTPDGHAWLAMSIALAAHTAMPASKFDVQKTLTPVVRLAVTPMGLAVPAASPFHSLQGIIQGAQERKLNAASSGNGTPPHLALALFEDLAKISATHIPYKGGAPALVDLIGGQTDFGFVNLAEAQQHIKTGKLRLLSVVGAQRLPDFPEVPSTVELGLPGLRIAGWTGIMVPVGTPPQVVNTIANAALVTARRPEFVQRAAELGFVVDPLGPAAFQRFLGEEVAQLRQLIADRNLRMD